jgi:hypothetical protein
MDRRQNGLGTSPTQDEAIAALACGNNVRMPARAMSILFLVGMVLTIATGTLNCMSRIRCSGSPDYELDRDRPLDNVPIEGV